MERLKDGRAGARTDGQTDGQTDGRMDGQTDGRTDGRTDRGTRIITCTRLKIAQDEIRNVKLTSLQNYPIILR